MSIDLVAANHTGRELELMLKGSKPLSMFYAEISELPDEELIPEKMFSPYIQSGEFIRYQWEREGSYIPKLGRNSKIICVFYALLNEEWRIKSMILLKSSFDKSSCRWNEALERIECSLLGYTEEETDAWCRHSPLINR